MSTNPEIRTRRIRVYGVVQGVGFRPTASRLAAESGITGTVANRGSYVEIIAQGEEESIEAFLLALRLRPPKRAAVLKIDVKDVQDAPAYDRFRIIESEKVAGEIFISPDIAVCDDCIREMFDRNDRRYLHPFINCTSCGPRLTILEGLPYDRERTSMKEFPMCPACKKEYYDRRSRRFDAQPVACPDCGPEYYLLKSGERGHEAISRARRMIAEGKIVAIKGIGGFHLCCSAENPEAVRTLRTRKTRPMKPFAVMMRDMDTVRRECEVPPEAEEILTGHQKPIVLLPRIPGGFVCEETAPDNPKIGVMLPYAPIHLLLFHYDDGIEMPDCLIMTSGNVSGAPICRDDAEAEEELGNLADAILSHNRKIRIRADDSVMDIFDGKPYMIRRSRGYAPLPFILGEAFDAPVIGIGGELKNTFCVGRGGIFYPSPYIGDMEDIRTYAALTETVGRFTKLLEAKPEVCAADLHPRYHSAEAAESLGLPVVRIQHHYAHILSCMAENEHTSPVIGLSFDGTGYGTDGTIWGGEVLLADFEGFERKGHIKPFLMTGGDAAAREGWRVAVTMLGALYKDNSVDIIQKLGIAEPSPAKTILMMADRGLNTVTSTSAGRLFDAASAVLGLRRASTFEGEASMALEFAAGRYAEKEREPAEWGRVSFSEENPIVLPTDELIKRLAEGRLAGEDTDKLAYIFHEGLAEMAAAAASEIAGETGIRTAALSGGCFQNLLLTRLTAEKLKKRGFCVLLHSQIPPNDGGIALGQAAAAAFRIHKQNQ